MAHGCEGCITFIVFMSTFIFLLEIILWKNCRWLIQLKCWKTNPEVCVSSPIGCWVQYQFTRLSMAVRLVGKNTFEKSSYWSSLKVMQNLRVFYLLVYKFRCSIKTFQRINLEKCNLGPLFVKPYEQTNEIWDSATS